MIRFNFDDFDGEQPKNKVEMPLILKDKNGQSHLVSGNTRLMICRALGITPRVIIGKLN